MKTSFLALKDVGGRSGEAELGPSSPTVSTLLPSMDVKARSREGQRSLLFPGIPVSEMVLFQINLIKSKSASRPSSSMTSGCSSAQASHNCTI